MNNSRISYHKSGFEIAIIGMAGRFPGAKNINEFWQNLKDGIESISFFSDEELATSRIDPAALSDPNYVKARGVIEDAECFDASFFGYNPSEAQIMDPQHRVFLECAWEALENAGYDAGQYKGSIGVYAGISMNTYLWNNLYSNRDLIESLGEYQAIIGNDKDFLTTRCSYKLNLKGPGVVVQTACSTSLVAVHLACQSLLSGECDMALSGGVSIKVPQKSGRFYQEEGILSPDGHCRAFDAKAQGTVSGNGVGIVVLKRLADALADGDCIHAVIKGSAINNDGASKVGYTAPSVEGQAKVITRALAMAEVPPETIGYIETHGTGTALGDPIEIAALTQAFRASTSVEDAHKGLGYCAIGSVKTNIGHLDTAAGVAGLIKTVLALKHKLLPPSLHFKKPNPKIDFTNSPFYVNAALSQWGAANTPCLAGVSSFGIGGTNAHAVLEEAPPLEASGESRPWQLLVLSAKTSTALETTTTNLLEHLKGHPDLSLADAAYTLQVGRVTFRHRRILVCRDLDDAVTTLEAGDTKRLITNFQESADRPIVFMFPGQGAQYVNMGLELYQTEPTFRKEVDKCSKLLKPHLKKNLRELLYPSKEKLAAATHQLEQTLIAQPALFVVEYALAQLWMEWGVHPQAMIGHSIGEYVAACLAGVFSLEEALELVSARGRLMQHLPVGAMLAVSLPQRNVESLLGDRLSLAAINEPSVCVVSGPLDAVDSLQAQLADKEVACRRLQTSHAFHSEMMDPILKPFTEQVSKIDLNPPEIPYISNVTGTWIQAQEAMDPSYWARHLRQTVRFSVGMQALLKEPGRALLEVGPGNTLSALAKRHSNMNKASVIVSSLRHPRERPPLILDPSDFRLSREKNAQGGEPSDVAFLLNTMGQLWLSGKQLDLSAFYANEQRHRVPLPTYPFESKRYWIEPQEGARGVDSRHVPSGKKPDIADWFYIPVWEQSIFPVSVDSVDVSEQKRRWLVFTDTPIDRGGLGTQLVERLEELGQEVFVVTAGDGFAQYDNRAYTINPREPADYEAMIKSLHAQKQLPDRIVHLWEVDPDDETPLEVERMEKAQDLGIYSLLFLTQALGKQNFTEALEIVVVSNNMHEVIGDELLCPEKATVLGAVKIIPQEYPHISCRSIDLVIPKSGIKRPSKLIDRLLAEFKIKSSDLVIAYRGKHRWVQSFKPVRFDGEAEGTPRLREGGVYLVTGGLGGMGLVFAENLARTVRAKLILTGRSAFPARDEWEGWLATHDEDDGVSRKIQKVRKLEELGAEVLVASADVANLQQMQEVITQAEERFGRINGVIHTAGVPDYAGVIQRRSREMTESILAPKVRGALVLDSLLKNVELDFLIFCSSLSSILYKIKFGQVGYCAANDFLDAFAYYKTAKDGIYTVSINWTDWQGVGMSIEARRQRDERHDIPDMYSMRLDALLLSEDNALLPSEGVEVFRRILEKPFPRVVVSTPDLMIMIERNNALTESDLMETVEKANLSQPTHPRPELSDAYVAPRNKLEQTIADIWQKLFGIEQVGIHDDFFQLGGHSLLATQLLNRLSQNYKAAKLSLAALFDNPTVAGLAQLIENAYSQQNRGKDSASPGEEKAIRGQLQNASPADHYGLIEEYLKKQIAQMLKIEVDQLRVNGSLKEFRSELIVANLIWVLKRDFQLRVYPHEIEQRLSIEALAQLIATEIDRMSGLKQIKSSSTLSPLDDKRVRKRKDKQYHRKSLERNKSMVFLFSAPRSGSTLLRLMLAGHSALFCPPELMLLGYDNMREWSRNQRSRFSRTGLEVALMALMGIDANESKAFVDDLTQQDMPIHEVYRMIQQRAGTRILVDKTPSYTMNIDTLEKAEELFESAQYIHLVRHPYAVIESFVRNRIDKLLGEEGDSYAIAEKYWTMCNSNVLDFCKELDSGRYYRVHYENLVREPGKVMSSLCDFLGIPFKEAVLYPYDSGRMIDGPGDPDIFQHDKIEASVGKIWRNIKLPRQLSEYSRNLATDLNYELPHEVDETPATIERIDLNNVEPLLANLDGLSDEEVDTLFNKMLTDEEGDE